MMQGTPYIYQGEEIGMTNIRFGSIEDYRDVETLNFYRIETVEIGRSHDEVMEDIYLKSRDNARTPMQWDDSADAGFGSESPWMGFNPNYKQINVKQALSDPYSILHYYRELIRLRKRYDIMVYGDFTLLLDDHPDVFAYKRTLDDQELLVFANFSGKAQSVAVREPAAGCELLIANYPDAGESISGLQLRPYEARVYLCKAALSETSS